MAFRVILRLQTNVEWLWLSWNIILSLDRPSKPSPTVDQQWLGSGPISVATAMIDQQGIHVGFINNQQAPYMNDSPMKLMNHNPMQIQANFQARPQDLVARPNFGAEVHQPIQLQVGPNILIYSVVKPPLHENDHR